MPNHTIGQDNHSESAALKLIEHDKTSSFTNWDNVHKTKFSMFDQTKVCQCQHFKMFTQSQRKEVVIMKIPCMNKSMVIMNNGQLIINSLWSNSMYDQLIIELLWTTDHVWTIGLSIWTIVHMANWPYMKKLFIIYDQLTIDPKLFINCS